MKVYAKKTYGKDSFKMIAEIPSVKPNSGWKAPQIHKFSTSFTNQPLIYRFRSLGASSGTIKLSFRKVDPNSLAVLFDK